MIVYGTVGKIRPVIADNASEFLAIHLFGWKWMSWIGRPVRGHPEYHSETVRSRQLLSARQLKMPGWKKFLADPKIEAREATGDEPLAYTYCSSGCSVEPVPDFFGSEDYLVLEQARKVWKRQKRKWKQYESMLPPAHEYRPGEYSFNALVVLGYSFPECQSKVSEDR